VSCATHGIRPDAESRVMEFLTNNTNRFVVHERLLETIVEDANIKKAIQRVVSNKGQWRC